MTRHLVTTPLVRARSTPDSLEAATDYACVMDGMSGVAVAQVILDQPEIVAPIRQSEAAGVPQHVRMDRRQTGTHRGGCDQVIDSLTGQRLATFRDEEPGKSIQTGCQIAFKSLEDWLRDQAAVVGAVPDRLVARLEARCRELSIGPPSADRVDRIVRAAIRSHDDCLYGGIQGRLTFATRDRLEALLRPRAVQRTVRTGIKSRKCQLAPF